MKTRPTINISKPERVARMIVGGLGAAGGAILLTRQESLLALVLAVLLVAAGLDLLVTGALGHCPLYARFGHVPHSLQRGSHDRAST